MKQLFLIVCLTCFVATLSAQKGSAFGFRAGLNYNGNGDLVDTATSAIEDSDRDFGFHIGVFGKLGNKLFFRPELVYTNTTSEYDSGDFNFQKLDAPLLVGLKVLGPISVFAGPAIQYVLDSEFEDTSIDNVENDFTVGLNFGVSVNIKKFGVDLRYERGFTDNEADFLANNGVDINRLDTRPDQLILSLSIAL